MRGSVEWLEQFFKELRVFSERESYIESVIVVGSYARGMNRVDSDLDLCVITTGKEDMLQKPEFVKRFGAVEEIQTEYYGACTSLRVWYRDGAEVEVGLVEPSWINRPLDEGTRRVLSDGYKVIIDKKNYFQHLEFL